jgi:hypothetical protein
VWSDSLLAAERAHLLRLIAWGAASVLLGTLVVMLIALRRAESPLLRWFGGMTAAWGAAELALAAVAWRGLALRDVAGFTRLDRLLWLNVGLDVGFVAVGVTLAVLGWRLGRRLGLVGSGAAVVTQGLALLLLDARLLATLAAIAS